MRQIPPKHRKMIDEDPFFKRCVRADEGECSGRITIEHVFIYGSKQIAEMWNYLPLCWYHHLGAGLNKRLNEKIAVMRASAEELAKYPKKNWQQIRKYLLTT